MSHWTTGLESSIGMISSKLSESTSSVPCSSGNSSNCVDDCGHPTQLAYPAYYQSWKRSPYGFAAYIRWQIDSGDFLCRLIMAKCNIASANKLSTSQMELIAALLSKRGRKVIEKKVKFHFGELYRLQTLQLP